MAHIKSRALLIKCEINGLTLCRNVTSLTPHLPHQLTHCVDVKTRPLLIVIYYEKVAVVLSLTFLNIW